MPTGESLLVLVDYFSRWVEVDVIKSTSSEAIIKCLDRQFSRYGVPNTLRSDNGPNPVSAEMEEYLDEMGIKHRLTTPLLPRANGEVERQKRSLLKAMRVAHAEGRDWRLELNKLLLAYRSTPHTCSTTGRSPAELLYGKCVQEGDLVLLEKKKENKLSSHYEKEPYQVTARYGDQVQLKSPQGAEYRRYIQHVKQFVIPDREPQDQQPAGPVAVPSEHALGQEITPSLETGGGASPDDGPNQEQLLPRRSGRVTRTRPPNARET